MSVDLEREAGASAIRLLRRDPARHPLGGRTMMHDNPQFTEGSMDIVVWLRSLGLEQYEAAFRENAIRL
jgi:hypothetical protein